MALDYTNSSFPLSQERKTTKNSNNILIANLVVYLFWLYKPTKRTSLRYELFNS